MSVRSHTDNRILLVRKIVGTFFVEMFTAALIDDQTNYSSIVKFWRVKLLIWVRR